MIERVKPLPIPKMAYDKPEFVRLLDHMGD